VRDLRTEDPGWLMPAAEVLDRAADLITAGGHFQGSYWRGIGIVDWAPGVPVCAVGAVLVVRGVRSDNDVHDWHEGDDDPALVALAEALGLEHVSHIPVWNDRWRRWPWFARRRVLEAMRRAARVCR